MHLLTPFVLVTFAYLFAGVRCGDGKTCDAVMDLVFLVDKSGSIKPWQFLIEKGFVYNITDGLDVGVDKTHVAVSLFATGFHLQWCFEEYMDKAILLQQELDMECPHCIRGQTNTGVGMNKLRMQMLLDPACKVRSLDQKIPRVVVVITDGLSTEKPPNYPVNWLQEQSDLVRSQGHAKVIAIGVGENFANANSRGIEDLKKIADNKNMMFYTADFNDLDSIREKIFAKICEAADKGCEAKVDIEFMLDVSGSMYRKGQTLPTWTLMKEMVKEMIDNFDIGDNAHVALSLFGDVVENKWCFDDYFTKAEMKAAVNTLQCDSCKRGATVIGAALNDARLFVLKPGGSCGARPTSVPKIVVVLTDGKDTESKQFFRNAAADLKALPNTTVMVMGVGNYNLKHLETIASSEEWVYTDINFDNFLSKAKNAAKAGCAEVSGLPVRPCKIGWTFDVTTQRCYKWFDTYIGGGFVKYWELCAMHDAEPVRIESLYTQNIVTDISSGTSVWVNIQKSVTSGHEWVTGTIPSTAITWNNWRKDEPSSTPGWDCAVAVGISRKRWQTLPCFSTATFVCSTPRKTE